MNSAEFNMVVLAATAVAALVGKYVYERVMTRIEARQALEARRKPDGHGPDAGLAQRS